MRSIYMDHAATSPADPLVVEAMMPYFTEKYGNASSLHVMGRDARQAVEGARQKVASLIGAKKEEIIFTSGGTESDNLALKGIALKNRARGDHIITSAIEHHAVLNACEYLQSQGFSVTVLPVDRYGLVNPVDVENAITDSTIIISVMHANNEIGTVQPIEEIGKIAAEHDIYFHTDAVQSAGKIPVNVDSLGVDLLAMSAHKLSGPKGVGALYIRKGTLIEPLLHGGGHERNLRSGTENVPGIVGFGKAAELAAQRLSGDMGYLSALRDSLIKGLLAVPESYLNGHPDRRLPNNVNVRFSYIEGESLILNLDMLGIAASTGSACSSASLEPSHVLMALGMKHEEAHGSLRLTIGRENTRDDVEYVLEAVPGIVRKLREMSPLAR